MNETYQNLTEHFREAGAIDSIESVLGWDQETLMPPRGAARRADQLAVLSRIAHEKVTDPRVEEWIAELEGADLPEDAAAGLREMRREHDRERKLPADLVTDWARTRSLASEAWKEARQKDDFASFVPWLEKIFDLARRRADCFGYADSPYDALLDEYEPGMTGAEISRLFADVREGLVPIVGAIADAPRQPDRSILDGDYEPALQERLCRRIATDIGFDFEAGRLDVSAHPLCSGFAPEDVRITTRYDRTDFGSALFGVVHEAGHGLYEQGLDPGLAWTPVGGSRSLGVHESQSRLWENQVGRSRPFWERYLPVAAEVFPEPLAGVDLDAFHFAINEVKPSLIRVEADEVTYNLHVILRFEIERDLLEGRLSIADLPALWKDRMESDLGVRPPDDATGCLQDVHWSFGLIGYFPTYTLGTLLSAQLYDRARADIAGLEAGFAEGRFEPLLTWLRERIHQPASRYPTPELIERAVGEPLRAAPFLDYLKARYGPLYGI